MLENVAKRNTMFTETSSMPSKIGNMVHPDPNPSSSSSSTPLDDIDDFARNSSFSTSYDPTRLSGDGSPMMMSPWNQTATSPWPNYPSDPSPHTLPPQSRLIGSLVREEGHIYSLAAKNGLLYTGSDSKNIRVWKNMKEFSGFKSNSGLVKAIVISGDGRIFTGHQDGKIRVWRADKSPKSPGGSHRRVGTMPKFFDILRASIRPGNYVEVKRKRSTVWIKHTDAISCLSMDEEKGLLYSASWDRTFKVWRAAGSKCLESVRAHDDAVNSVVASGGLVYTGSADGSVKVWRREERGGNKAVRHVLARTLLRQESAVTALAVGGPGSVVYCGSSDGLVNFWEVERELSHGGVLRGHRLAVLCLEAAGSLVLSGSADKTICVWRREGSAHTCLSVLTGHTGPVKCLTVEGDNDKDSSEGDRRWIVYSGSLDKSVKVWSVSETAPDLQQRDGSFNWGSMPSA